MIIIINTKKKQMTSSAFLFIQNKKAPQSNSAEPKVSMNSLSVNDSLLCLFVKDVDTGKVESNLDAVTGLCC